MLSAESVSWSTEVLTLHSAIYISNSAEPVSCIELFLKKVEVVAVGGTRFSPPGLLALWTGGGRELCMTTMFLNPWLVVKMCQLCFVMLPFLACSGGLCISFRTCFWLLLPMPAGVDAEFHAKGLLAPGSDVLSGHCQCAKYCYWWRSETEY